MNLSLNIYYSVVRNGKDADGPLPASALLLLWSSEPLHNRGVTTSLKCFSGHFAILSDGNQVV